MPKYLPAAFAFVFSASAAAQQSLPAPLPNDQPIVVQAERTRDRDREVREFVHALTPAPTYSGQLGRFEWSVCPKVFGLRPTQDDAVATRIREVGRAVGIPVASEPCVGNALVIVAGDKKTMVKWMKQHMPGYFVNSAGRPLNIRDDGSHATAWHIPDLLNPDGTQATVDVNRVYHVKSELASHIRPSSRPHFLGSVVVIEASALVGLTTTEVGDYAAMRTFAQTDPTKLENPPPPTILTILDAPDGASLPLTLTEWDLGFLRGLYSSDKNQYAVTQRQQIARTMRKELSNSEQ